MFWIIGTAQFKKDPGPVVYWRSGPIPNLESAQRALKHTRTVASPLLNYSITDKKVDTLKEVKRKCNDD